MAKRARPKPGRQERKASRPDRSSSAATPESRAAHPAPPPLPPIQPPDAKAIALFQQAMDLVHRRRFEGAAEQFRQLLDLYPREGALLDRARVYLELAQRELNRKPANPRTVEERLTAATAALNNDEDAEAEQLVRSVLADDAKHDLALYLMAAIEARRSDQEAALSFLGRAIAVSPEVRAQARHDPDFDPMRSTEAFQMLVDPQLPPASQRRLKRPR
jgi:tetratricopeptide (TPR) repeat protein